MKTSEHGDRDYQLINMEKVEDYVLKQDKHAQLVYLKRRLEDLEQVHKEGKKQVTLTLSNIYLSANKPSSMPPISNCSRMSWTAHERATKNKRST